MYAYFFWIVFNRGVAQLASALEWGSRGRGFKSHRSDFFIVLTFPGEAVHDT